MLQTLHFWTKLIYKGLKIEIEFEFDIGSLLNKQTNKPIWVKKNIKRPINILNLNFPPFFRKSPRRRGFFLDARPQSLLNTRDAWWSNFKFRDGLATLLCAKRLGNGAVYSTIRRRRRKQHRARATQGKKKSRLIEANQRSQQKSLRLARPTFIELGSGWAFKFEPWVKSGRTI